MTALHRCYVAGFKNERMYTIQELQELTIDQRKACLLPIDHLLQSLPKLCLNEFEALSLQQGKVILHQTLPKESQLVALYHQTFIGIGVLDVFGYLKPKRLIQPEFIPPLGHLLREAE